MAAPLAKRVRRRVNTTPVDNGLKAVAEGANMPIVRVRLGVFLVTGCSMNQPRQPMLMGGVIQARDDAQVTCVCL